MCYFLPLIAFTHACVPCYGKIITTDVFRSMWEAFVFEGSIVSSSLTIEHF